MTKRQLEQYIALKSEIKKLEARIKKLEEKPDEIVLDSVSGSDLCFPYSKRTMIIEGLDTTTVNQITKLTQRLNSRKIRANTLMLEIEQFIDEIEDSSIRQIIQLKYLDGNPWNVVTTKIYGYPCGDRARMKIERFFKKF